MHGVTICDWSDCKRMRQVKEKRLRKGNVTMGSVGHMRGLQCGTRLMVQWVLGIVGGDHAKVGEGRAGAVDVGGPAVYGK